jgi:hypothetical protein
MLAPAWQETARAIRPCLPGLLPAALAAYARALHAEAALRAFDYRIKCPAPFFYRQDYNRALVTSALEALSHGDPAAIRQDPGGTWEVSAAGILTAIPAVLPRKPDNASAAPLAAPDPGRPAVSPRLAAPAQAATCSAADRVGALYVNPDGTFEVSTVTTGPPYDVTGQQPGHRKMTFAADRWEPRSAPTWQETAEAIGPYLPGLPPAAREAYARALLADAEKIAWDMTLSYPVPFRFAEDFTRALITSASEALRHGDRVAAIHPGLDGTYEVTGIRIPPVFPRKQD